MALKIGISVLYLLLSVIAIKASHILLTWHQKQQLYKGTPKSIGNRQENHKQEEIKQEANMQENQRWEAIKDNKETNPLFDRNTKRILYLLFILFSAVLGYFTAQNAVDTFAIFRLTLLYFILAVAAIVDGEKYIIPNILVLIFLVAGVVIGLIEILYYHLGWREFLFQSLGSLFILLVFLLLMVFLSKGGLGMGDVKLYAAIAFYSGISAACIIILFSFILCAMAFIPFLLLKKIKIKDAFPMGGFIFIGYGISLMLSLI